MSEAVRGGAWAIVVVKRLGSSFDGLLPLLSRRRKRRLAEAFLLDVLEAVRTSQVLERTILATEDAEAWTIGRRQEGLRVMGGKEGSSSVEPMAEAQARGAETVVLIQGDLPLLEAQDLAFLLGRVAQSGSFVLVPTPGSDGVSLAGAPLAEGFNIEFEEANLQAWRQEANRHGASCEVYALPAGLRPSTPLDLLAVYEAARVSRAKALLKGWGMGPALRGVRGEPS